MMLQSECGRGVLNKAFGHLTFILFFFRVQQQTILTWKELLYIPLTLQWETKKNHHEHKLPKEKNQGLTEMC